MAILVTGSSGFIGFHTAKKLLDQGVEVIGYDNENDYYDVNLKLARRTLLEQYPLFHFVKANIEDREDLKAVFEQYTIESVIHLAAQVGIRYCLQNPEAYIQSNLLGFYTVIELAKDYNVKKFVYASSSSVYGKNTKQPFSIEDPVDSPNSLYAATKKSNELVAHSYSHVFGLSTIGLRFFTVYGPFGRPDMAIPLFVDKISKEQSLDLYNYGKMKRDFTYVDDVVEGLMACLESEIFHGVFNLGNNKPSELEYVIGLIEQHVGKTAIKNYMPIQPGEMVETSADISHTTKHLKWEPKVSIESGIPRFIEWYKGFYGEV